jgi:hypothetical protein
MTVDAWRSELAQAKTNRDAAVALGLAIPTALPAGSGRILVLDDTSIVLGWDPDSDDDQLAIAAYHLLRLTARQHARRSDGPVDLDAVRTQIDDLRQALAPIDGLERHAGTADKAVARIRATAATLKADLIERITRLDTTLSTGPTAD